MVILFIFLAALGVITVSLALFYYFGAFNAP
jgi:hypothetical protein